ncbi:hypothetical protein L7D48_02485 [Streptomyces sp. S1A]|nr:hypothetical protein [Streptomyces sp. ICN903]MCG3039449.1 hypothetical protein [Streptomyces sp. ICN903]
MPWTGGRPVRPDSPLFGFSAPDEERGLREYVEELVPAGVELSQSKEAVR